MQQNPDREFKRLSEVLRKWRRTSDRTMDDVSLEIGISKSTLSRIESSGHLDSISLCRILSWLFELKTKVDES